ncbi:PTS fructose-like transporter subunit IIB [Longimicrobium sp.]|uniref:PTS fructose-like transporter subunit IIB n=1 Tax=Longimicrobium sp. TaxID=2029185 RepID=UPI002E31A809|nr:PTS fructose-like transporter subunit IIB [Longimicrobium sp.]HEX6042660.1 PTS fructose-like transporter subunit IIB [Longimicrobium sp.]
MKIAAVTACPTGVAHTLMAAEALKRTAAAMGHDLRVETQGSAGARDTLTDAELAAADVVIVAADIHVDTGRFAGRPVHAVRTADAIRHTRQVIEDAVALAAPAVSPDSSPPASVPSIETVASIESGASTGTAGSAASPESAVLMQADGAGKRLVGITACPTGIAHTFMAAEALQKAAAAMGHTIKVETQGSVGAKNQLTAEDIAAADAVVIAADTKVDTSRFGGKPVYVTSTKAAIKGGRDVVGAALAQPAGAAPSTSDDVPAPASAADAKGSRAGPYKHLMTGVSYMLPLVIAGGLCIALAFALGGIYAGEREGSLAWALSQIGGETAFHLFVAVLSGFIAFSIADRPGLAPGLVGGMLAQNLSAGFLGGIVSGFLAGYLTKFLAERIRLPATLEGLKPVLILPFLSTVIVGLGMIFVIAPPVQALNAGLNGWLLGLRGANAVLLGLILGTMMAVDMGGPLNKAAYTFAVGLLASKIYTPMAAVMAAGMTPALGVGLATFLYRGRFDEDERRAGGPAVVLGLSFITEGAIPFAAKDPIRVIPALVLGSATAGAISMLANVRLLVPHGGVFAAVIPGAVSGLPAYLAAIAAGTAVTAGALFVLKRPPPALTEPVAPNGRPAEAA